MKERDDDEKIPFRCCGFCIQVRSGRKSFEYTLCIWGTAKRKKIKAQMRQKVFGIKAEKFYAKEWKVFKVLKLHSAVNLFY
jgi:hypothetical protein